MKVCARCGGEHEKRGLFCSRSCANSRGPRSDEFKALVSSKLQGRRTRVYESKPRETGTCMGCGGVVLVPRKYCSVACWKTAVNSQKSAFESYRKACAFHFDVSDYPHSFDLGLVETFGWYRPSNRGNNLDGISRDHMLSVADGFRLGVAPTIVSHPANCELMNHTTNQRKRAGSSITLEELINRIECWDDREANVLDCKSS